MRKETSPKLLIKIEGIPRGRSQSIKAFTRSSSVQGGMNNIATREKLIDPKKINKQLGLIFKDCTISYRLPSDRWVVIPPDE